MPTVHLSLPDHVYRMLKRKAEELGIQVTDMIKLYIRQGLESDGSGMLQLSSPRFNGSEELLELKQTMSELMQTMEEKLMVIEGRLYQLSSVVKNLEAKVKMLEDNIELLEYRETLPEIVNVPSRRS